MPKPSPKTILPSFNQLLSAEGGEKYLDLHFDKKFAGRKSSLFDKWYNQTGETNEIYPSQGLLLTPYDGLSYLGKVLLNDEELWQTLRMRHYILEIFNHPSRLIELEKIENKGFAPLPKVKSSVMEYGIEKNIALCGRDLQMAVVGTNHKRVARRKLLKKGPFIVLGKRARIPFSGGAMPDIFGAPAAIASLAMCHALANLPRNGVFSNQQRQVDLAKAAFKWMEDELLLANRKDGRLLLDRWRKNVVGVIEPDLKSGVDRAEALYQVGVRTFRIYSPEPGIDAVETLKALKTKFAEKIEVFVGQVATLEQAKIIESWGADGLFVGIGGGGRCTTAVRSGSAVDWPILLWQMRGQIKIPVVVEGGASEHIGLTLSLGGSSIGVSRSAGGGTIESPGGLMYLVNENRQWFKPYGGEASARTKFQDGKMLACHLPAFVEGETTCAYKSYISHILPTMAQSVFFLVEDLILGLVFRGVESIEALQQINPSPIRMVTQNGRFQAKAH